MHTTSTTTATSVSSAATAAAHAAATTVSTATATSVSSSGCEGHFECVGMSFVVEGVLVLKSNARSLCKVELRA
jgi:hypothetical protein